MWEWTSWLDKGAARREKVRGGGKDNVQWRQRIGKMGSGG